MDGTRLCFFSHRITRSAPKTHELELCDSSSPAWTRRAKNASWSSPTQVRQRGSTTQVPQLELSGFQWGPCCPFSSALPTMFSFELYAELCSLYLTLLTLLNVAHYAQICSLFSTLATTLLNFSYCTPFCLLCCTFRGVTDSRDVQEKRRKSSRLFEYRSWLFGYGSWFGVYGNWFGEKNSWLCGKNSWLCRQHMQIDVTEDEEEWITANKYVEKRQRGSD